ncbi:enoyl-CoA hydratase/isomerase family protein [Myxococcota bacterium]|nr:enoyl-CoA hydratase/isomerase family protein [Myxococcota bacterium]
MNTATHVLCEKSDGVATVTLNRPERKNAMTPQMMCQLADTWQDLEHDDSIRAVVLTGQGEKAFCPGGDMEAMVPVITGSREPVDEWERRYRSDQTEISRIAFLNPYPFDKPIVAAINGDAISGGCEILHATDIRIASRKARFGLKEIERGLIPAGGSLAKLQHQVSYCRAAELVLLCQPISAEEARNIGLVNEIVEPELVLPRALEIARRLASFDPAAVQTSKSTLRRVWGLSEPEACGIQQQAYDDYMGSRT